MYFSITSAESQSNNGIVVAADGRGHDDLAGLRNSTSTGILNELHTRP